MSGPKHLWSGDWERDSADSDRNRPAPPEPAEPIDDELVEATSDRRRRVRMLAIATVTAIVVVVVGVVLADTLSGSSKPRPEPVASVPTVTIPQPTGNPQTQTNPNGGTGLGQTPGTQTTPGGGQSGQGGGQSGQGGGQTTPGGSQLGPGGNQAGPGGSVKPNTQPQVPQPTFTNQPTVHWLGMQIITSPTGAVVNTIQIGSEGDTVGFEPGDVIAAVAGQQISSARQIRDAVANVPAGAHVSVEIARGSTLITMAVTMQGRPTLQP